MNLGWGWEYMTDVAVQQVATYTHAGLYGQATEWKQTHYARLISERFPKVDGDPQKVLFCNGSEQALRIAKEMAQSYANNDMIVTADMLIDVPHRQGGLALDFVPTDMGFRHLDTGLAQKATEIAKGLDMPVLAAEHQTAYGRCGAFLAQEEWGVQADITVLGEAGGGGFAFGAVVAHQKYFDTASLAPMLLPGMEVACATGINVIEQMHEPIFANVTDVGYVLSERIEELAQQFPGIVEGWRGYGLCQGLVLHSGTMVDAFIDSLQHYGVLVTPCPRDSRTVRMTPPLLISETEVKWAVDQMVAACLDLQEQ